MSDPFPRPATAREVLESWKEIAAYLGRSVRAVQLWEKEEHLPIHRHQHDKQGTVFAYRDELDRWRDARSTSPPAAAPPVVRPARRWIFAGVAVVIVVAAALLWRWQSRRDVTAVRSVAVLPFTSNADVGQHVSDGVTELLIDDLAALQDLRVMARSSVFRYKAKPPVRAGEELDVDAIVTGDVRRGGEGYEVRVELIDVRDGAQMWSRRYEAPPAELPFLDGRMAADLSRVLRRRAPAAAPKYSGRPEAHEEYLLGLRDWNRRIVDGQWKRSELESSIRHFQRATELDPRFAAAYAGLANAYGVMVGYRMISPAEGTMKVLAAARKALELDPENGEAYTSIATTSFNNLWDFEGAERDYRRAIAFQPNYATAHQWYGESLQALGRFADARREIDLAYALDPLSVAITSTKCWHFYYERRYREAIDFARQIETRDASRTPHTCVTASLQALGELEAALDYADQHGMATASAVREAARRGGIRGVYEARLQSRLQHPERVDRFAVMIARHYAFLGDAEQAFAWLDKAYQRRDSDVPWFHVHPEFDALRADARFLELARRVGLPASALESTRALAERTPFRGITPPARVAARAER